MNAKTKRILVTGGAGYIGSHVCKTIATAGFLPVAYDNLTLGHEEAVQWGPLEIGDIADRRRFEAVLRKYRPDAVMHFAAYAYVGESVVKPARYYRNNVVGTLTMLEALRDFNIGKIIFSSTCAIYGILDRVPVTEDHRLAPINPYGRSKLMIEWALKDYAATYGIKFVSLRYFNAAGADPDGEIGEDHRPETHLIPLVLQTARGRRSHVEILGSDYPTPDGTCIRDYIHVSDLAEAHLLALDYLLDGGESDVFNLGNGNGFSVNQVIAAAEKVTGRSIPKKPVPRRPGDPPILIGDSEKFKKRLGWKPSRADLDTIIATAWQWMNRSQRA